MLEVKGINTFYGKSHVLHDLFLEVKGGELVGLLGRNGMGKTTTLKSIMGLVPPKTGHVLFDDNHASYLPPHRIPRLGIGYVPQGRHIFPKLTVMENIKIALVHREIDQELLDQIFEYFPQLKERLSQPGGTLSGGEQQMLAIARGLITKPKLMLLDEPTEGLMPILVNIIQETIRSINEKGVSLLLVEQNIKMALNICKRIYIIEKGRIVYEGLAKELIADETTQQRYLGVHI
ncbi:MAG: ABC transporter ATP-binding protein [Thermodesulfobacteriota bacterium]|nr:ABC transporter ATP-binding protein [Thermodesulfobacteriota bacterium]